MRVRRFLAGAVAALAVGVVGAEVTPGRVVAVANTHPPSDPYGPYLVRDGGSRSDVLKLERDTRPRRRQALAEAF